MMSHGFKSRFEQMQEGKPTDQAPVSNETGEDQNLYVEAGHVRNVCFVWLDGKMKFLNYAYLVSGEYLPNESMITLAFTSETVVIKGVNLSELFNALLSHLPKQIVCTDARYNNLIEKDKFAINEIQILNGQKD